MNARASCVFTRAAEQVSNWFVNARARVWKPVVDRASRDIGSSTGGAAAGGGGAVFVSALGGGDEFHIGIGAATSAGAADSGLGTPKRARTRKRNRYCARAARRVCVCC